MTTVAVLGAGAGGLATVVELAAGGHDVALWHRSASTIAPYSSGQIAHRGILGTGSARVLAVTTDLGEALRGAEVVILSLPAFLHPPLFAELAERRLGVPIVLSPGHVGGALQLRQLFRHLGAALPPVAELSTLPYVARVRPEGGVEVTGRAPQLRCGVLPGGDQAADAAAALFSCRLTVCDVLCSSLSNTNLVLHPPGAILGAAWIEATGGNFAFYVEGTTPGVARVLDGLDAERRELARSFGHELPRLAEEMVLVGTATAPGGGGGAAGDRSSAGLVAGRSSAETAAEAIRSGAANRSIQAPGSLSHRYYREDFAFGLEPFVALAELAGVKTPIAAALLALAGALLGSEMPPGRDAAALGIEGLSLEELLAEVRG